jgi:hypothetical protein
MTDLDDLRKRVEEWELRVAPGYGTVLIRDLWREVQEQAQPCTTQCTKTKPGDHDPLRTAIKIAEDCRQKWLDEAKARAAFEPVTAEELAGAIGLRTGSMLAEKIIAATGPLYRQRKT